MTTKMTIIIALVIAIVGGVLLWSALHYSGDAGKAKGELTCVKADASAASAAVAAQHREDIKSIAALKTMLAAAQRAAALAAQQAGQAEARAQALTATLDSLNRSNPNVKAWSDTPLPPDLLRGMRAQANDQAADDHRPAN